MRRYPNINCDDTVSRDAKRCEVYVPYTLSMFIGNLIRHFDKGGGMTPSILL